jgi:hypothetical protein
LSLNGRPSQLSLLDAGPTLMERQLAEATLQMAQSGDVEERGAIYTRTEVADFILDLAGFTVDRPIHQMRLLEPSFGGGEFLRSAVTRLITAWRSYAPGEADIVSALSGAIVGVELHQGTFQATRRDLISHLTTLAVESSVAESLVDSWLVQGDFLRADWTCAGFDFVVGNPPYVRQERIPTVLLQEYRRRYATMFDRADLYVPFIERGLSLLTRGGRLAFICSDRWMKNRYGGPLRELVSSAFHLEVVVDMVDTPAFSTDVIAYPAITVIARRPGTRSETTRVARRPEVSAESLAQLAHALSRAPSHSKGIEQFSVAERSSAPWVLENRSRLDVLRRIEADFPPLETSRCRVGIGVATGADKDFIGPMDELDVEDERKLPLVRTRDIESGRLVWRGLGVVNPFEESGALIELAAYPKTQAYFLARHDRIASRHCAKRSSGGWYRTIDRITPSLTQKPKLLIPDIKGAANVVYDEGAFYPHHNLYFVTSEEWDLRALQSVLKSSVTQAFIRSYSTPMRGGFLRFQAQYLRRLRLPAWHSVSSQLRSDLAELAESSDCRARDEVVAALYGMSSGEVSALTSQVPNAA